MLNLFKCTHQVNHAKLLGKSTSQPWWYWKQVTFQYKAEVKRKSYMSLPDAKPEVFHQTVPKPGYISLSTGENHLKYKYAWAPYQNNEIKAHKVIDVLNW